MFFKSPFSQVGLASDVLRSLVALFCLVLSPGNLASSHLFLRSFLEGVQINKFEKKALEKMAVNYFQDLFTLRVTAVASRNLEKAIELNIIIPQKTKKRLKERFVPIHRLLNE